ncbi:AraC-type DNA-binding protein [Mucilaginibacter pineti]|uniref:AraC-type DNA-binding protein n=1 Tax=Mucilaginibacter pineti TaxID=1391627 RepID=A0A1G6ZU06_9SPHI|nr:AraC family transcriptional regulator [Mucilaginibacter pineti]SDE06021.1 AraC-type DNA-binding protein [Mucilaginibacter pineti]
MKPQLLKIPYGPDHSFGVRKEMAPNINNRWHYHPEIELIHFHSGFGTQFVGDHISQFEPGDVVLVGCNLPHFWKYDEVYYNDPIDSGPYSTVIHFFENFIGERFLHLPETRHIRALLERAKRGILFKGLTANKIGGLIEKIYQADGIGKILALITCLSEIALCEEQYALSSIGFKYDFPESENKRINAIYNYSFSNFQKKIKQSEIAGIAGMTANSFCRYFKGHTGKTYSDFLTEIRIGYACKLLISNNASIKEICYESGFNNFSSFHECFKRLTGKTPQVYQKAYKNQSS